MNKRGTYILSVRMRETTEDVNTVKRRLYRSVTRDLRSDHMTL